MKYLIIIVGLFAACGDASTKNENNENNIVINNANSMNSATLPMCAAGQKCANVNGEAGCFDECESGLCADGFNCQQGICLADVGSENDKTKCDGCLSRADCRADQECVDNDCRTHLNCGRAGIGAGECVYEWSDCDDGKEYSVECADQSCTCFVNGETTGEFTNANVCGDENAHRVANDSCEWLVPEVSI